MKPIEIIDKILHSRSEILTGRKPAKLRKGEAEGGCGVIGMACSEKVSGRHLLQPLRQMRNRGNGKGGGIAAAGLDHRALGVAKEVLDKDFLVAVAYLDPQSRSEVEQGWIHSCFEVDKVYPMPRLDEWRKLPRLEVKPPEVVLYFVRVKKESLETFRKKNELDAASDEDIEQEIVYQNSFSLNSRFYEAEGEKRAFVLSHGKNLLVMKMVGFGDDVISYYKLEDFHAHVWIGHHRYPTKGRVWHPGGAHPFIGMNEALVHNGDFANYSSMTEYLAQRNIHSHFLTDTEVSVLAFDLLTRTYKYPLEYAIECLAPTTEIDFARLPGEKQSIYKALQQAHIHGSPDGPWFFLIAQSLSKPSPQYRLIGITDTSMLRPQVFALQEGEASIGLIASEKQAIDATLESLSNEDARFWGCADRYWNARGGSHTDGGAFFFTAYSDGRFECSDKFGRLVTCAENEKTAEPYEVEIREILGLADWDGEQQINEYTLQILAKLIDSHYPTEGFKRSRLLSSFHKILPCIIERIEGYALLSSPDEDPTLLNTEQTLAIDASRFAPEGENSLALAIVRMAEKGFKKFVIFNCRGHRFIGNGLGKNSHGIRIDVFGSSGDYLASGIDGAEIAVHGNVQDQAAQIMKDGMLVIYGDVGQAFLYGAKGGKVFVLGNAAGRPLINAVGVPRVVINGTCLDYLAESFMAGDPLRSGGFVIINGIAFDAEGEIIELDNPYPGSNLFSLPSGGAVYIRDPEKKVSEQQLNGGEFVPFTERDWEVVLPYLEENQRLFDIPVSRLLTYQGAVLSPSQAYRKLRPGTLRVLEPEEAWVKKTSTIPNQLQRK